MGATDDLKINCINIESKQVNDFIHESGCVWKFNPHGRSLGTNDRGNTKELGLNVI